MSLTRNIDPQLLSIQAIIQKSQFKSRMFNNIPVDFKTLFNENARQQHYRPMESKKIIYETSYSQTINHDQQHMPMSKRNIPTSLPRQTRSQFLRDTAKKNDSLGVNGLPNPCIAKTTRTIAQSRQKNRIKYERKSFEQQNPSFNHKNHKRNTLNAQQETNIEYNQRNLRIESLAYQIKKKPSKFCRFEYEFVVPQKDKKQQGLRKVWNRNKSSEKVSTESFKCDTVQQSRMRKKSQKQYIENQSMNLESTEQPSKQSIHKQLQPQKQKKKKSQIIPHFVMAAIIQQKKMPTKNIYLPQKFQELRDQKIGVVKAAKCVESMKKVMSLNKIRKPDTPQEQSLVPKALLIRLLQKQKAKIFQKSSQPIRESKIKNKFKDRTFSNKFIKQPKQRVEEDLKGWDILEGNHYYDQY